MVIQAQTAIDTIVDTIHPMKHSRASASCATPSQASAATPPTTRLKTAPIISDEIGRPICAPYTMYTACSVELASLKSMSANRYFISSMFCKLLMVCRHDSANESAKLSESLAVLGVSSSHNHMGTDKTTNHTAATEKQKRM